MKHTPRKKMLSRLGMKWLKTKRQMTEIWDEKRFRNILNSNSLNYQEGEE